MTLVNQSAPAGVAGGGNLFMPHGGVAFPVLKPSQLPGIFIVVHAEAIGIENVVIKSATNEATTNVPYRRVKPLEQSRRVIRDSRFMCAYPCDLGRISPCRRILRR